MDSNILQDYVDGLSLNDIATKYNKPLSSVYYLIRKNGVNRPRSRGNCNHCYFDSIDCLQKAYWLGFIAADGCVYVSDKSHATKHTLTLTLAQEDRYHVEQFALDLQSTNKIYTTKSNTVTFACSSSQIVLALSKYGIGPRKSFNLYPHHFADEQLEMAYWLGMIDGDGCLSRPKRKGKRSFQLGLCGTKEICEGFLRWVSKYQHTHTKVSTHGSIYQVRFGPETSYQIMSLLYQLDVSCLWRKFQIYQDYREYRLSIVNKAGKQIYKGI